jgi:hypothetical protein
VFRDSPHLGDQSISIEAESLKPLQYVSSSLITISKRRREERRKQHWNNSVTFALMSDAPHPDITANSHLIAQVQSRPLKSNQPYVHLLCHNVIYLYPAKPSPYSSPAQLASLLTNLQANNPSQISKNLSNTRETFGPASPQYRAVRQVLEETIRQASAAKEREQTAASHGDGGTARGGVDLVEELRGLFERELRLAGE